jgi:hypothetical protein
MSLMPILPKDEEEMLSGYIYLKHMRNKKERKSYIKSLQSKYDKLSDLELQQYICKIQLFIREKFTIKAEANPFGLEMKELFGLKKNFSEDNQVLAMLLSNLLKNPEYRKDFLAKQKIDFKKKKNLIIFEKYIKKYGESLMKRIHKNKKKFSKSSNKVPQKMNEIMENLMHKNDTKIKEFKSDFEDKIKSKQTSTMTKHSMLVLGKQEMLLKSETTSSNGTSDFGPESSTNQSVSAVAIADSKNTNYLSCLVQVLFHFPKFAKVVCKFRVDQEKKNKFLSKLVKEDVSKKKKLKISNALKGCNFICNLQTFFYNLLRKTNSKVDINELFKENNSPLSINFSEINNLNRIVDFIDFVFKYMVSGFKLNEKVFILT